MTQLNEVGDVVLTEPRAMLALADRSRLTLHDALRRGGPATASDLAPLLGLEPQEILKHLEALEGVGLVERSQARAGNDRTKWAAIGKGVYFEIPEDAEGQRAARQLSNAMFLQYADLPRRWVDDHEPRLALTWTRAAGMLNVGLLISPDELRDIQSAFEGVLEPYLTRQEDRAPKGASRVRLLSYFMPESPEQGRP
jgi:DNA-binding transcriptional ArsR family regulator